MISVEVKVVARTKELCEARRWACLPKYECRMAGCPYWEDNLFRVRMSLQAKHAIDEMITKHETIQKYSDWQVVEEETLNAINGSGGGKKST